MKILLTGGGSGGHFYPIIAIAQEINTLIKEKKFVRPDLYFMSTDPYNEGLLFENNIEYIEVTSGKIRLSRTPGNFILNFFDLIKIFLGSLSALWIVFKIYPDVVFGKGGFASFPALCAARILRIPVIIHDSDTIPGKVNKWAGKFAQKIAISYPEAANYFPKDRVALTGNPVRKEIAEPLVVGSYEYLNLNPHLKTILIIGGSQGSKKINDIIMDVLPHLVEKYQVIHQTGKKNFSIIKETSELILQNSPYKDRYKSYNYLDTLTQRRSVGVSTLIVSRAGSSIFEIALWGKPSVIIPIPEPTSHDQRSNAYAYARSGAAIVIEEKNLVPNLFVSEINRIMDDPNEIARMAEKAKSFARSDSARLIAEQIISTALEHEK